MLISNCYNSLTSFDMKRTGGSTPGTLLAHEVRLYPNLSHNTVMGECLLITTVFFSMVYTLRHGVKLNVLR